MSDKVRRAWRVYLSVVVLLALDVALSGRVILPFSLFLVAWSVLLGWPTFRVMSSNLPRPCVWLIVAVVGYHALFGPAMLQHLATRVATRDDGLAIRLWPHVVHGVESSE